MYFILKITTQTLTEQLIIDIILKDIIEANYTKQNSTYTIQAPNHEYLFGISKIIYDSIEHLRPDIKTKKIYPN